MRKPEICLKTVLSSDLTAWIDTKKACYKEYVDQYYGGWVDEIQAELNTATFKKAMQMSYFRKITIGGETVGFQGYDELPDSIAGITIHMYEPARNHGIGSGFLRKVIALSQSTGKPAHLKVFKTNPAQRLYRRFGFAVYDETESHYLMEYRP